MRRNIYTLSVISVVVLALLVAEWSREQKHPVYQIDIVGQSADEQFLQREDILAQIGEDKTTEEAVFPLLYQDTPDLKALERSLQRNPFVANCQAARDVKGHINIRVEENRPLARVITSNQAAGYYLTTAGKKLPLSDNFTPHTLLITGEGTSRFEYGEFWQGEEGKRILDAIRYLSEEAFWQAQCTQLDVDQENNWTLYPQVGQHRIELGTLDNIKEKLYLLRRAYYEQILPRKGWGAYEVISFRYDGQIVCR